MVVEITYQCEISEGIHARPAGHIARLCNTFQCEVVWQNSRTALEANAKSALSLIATDTLLDDSCLITLHGADALSASVALQALLNNLPAFTTLVEPALAVTNGSLPRCLHELQPQYLTGVRISGGIAIAKPRVLKGVTFGELLTRGPDTTANRETEIARLTEGLRMLRINKEAALAVARGIEQDLLEAHLLFITDSAFRDSIISYLDAQMNAWSAIITAAMGFSAILERSSSHYIQERTLDMLDIATQLLVEIYGAQSGLPPALSLDEPALVIADSLTPGQFLALNKQHLAGLILSSTGKTSHTAILARSQGIPTLADINFATQPFSPRQEMVLDGDLGLLITRADDKILRYYRHEKDVQQQMRLKRPSTRTDKPLLTPDMILWGLDACDKNEVIKKMVDNLWLHQRTDCRDKLCQDIWSREVPFPTVVGSGFAIPHARSDAILDSTISVATLHQPVVWGGVSVDTVFMLTISQAAAENEHMKYFSTLARMLMNDEFVAKAKSAATPDVLYHLIISTLAG
ncbi:PTS sugar transporter subunit IIA [Pantoea phytobeneficialis]|uniref:PTS sugar transporter subunit IIA n=1 Tax=Pantoea phytobeneficialis TaxID=2052056 RepID=A0AAP9HB52_9GAMM|nr:PTS sugar transporter subunit IIA [Pantoea phytobeneficialis]MDO6407048.1 PTS sugar transporter subunit IIA [Pantoea phytobeneficialis]QGR10008.1 phosphoenolpyruvate--protein phosphotransferase [Pantoea phytobeneficialis]